MVDISLLKQSIVVIGLGLVGFGLMTACQGPAGPDGNDARLADSLPPVIEWISPVAGANVDSSVLLEVRAFDNIGVYRVSFFIAGFEFAGSLSDSAGGRYTYLWEAVNYPEGPYPLMARAWDDSRQTGTTPVRVVQVEH